MGVNLNKIDRLNTYSIHGVKYFDLSGITIEGEVLDISHLEHVDFSRSRLVNVKFTSNSKLVGFRFESSDLVNVSFISTNQNIETKLTLENFAFKGAKIEKSDFSEIVFSGENYFLRSKLYDVDFSNSNFGESNICDFTQSKFYGCSFTSSILDSTNLCDCLFSDCDLRSTRFNLTNLSAVAFKNCIVNSKTIFDEKIILEKNKSFENAHETYIQLKNLFRNTGHLLESQKFYLREVYTRGRKEKKRLNRIFLDILSFFSKVFQKPWQIFLGSFFSVFFFSGLYLINGIGKSCNGNITKDYFKCLYFSVITFTTVGYGDFAPCGISRLFAAMEALLGPAFLTLFMAALIKKSIQE